MMGQWNISRCEVTKGTVVLKLELHFKDEELSSFIGDTSMAKLIIWVVEVYRELTKACLKYALNKVFQHHGYQLCWTETLHHH